MTVAQLKAKLEDVPDETRVMLNDEPLADVEIAEIGRESVVRLWDVSHCEGT